MTISVRQADLADLPTLLSFEQRIVSAERPFDPTIREDPVSYYDLKRLLDSPDAVVLVAEDHGTIIGSGFARKKASREYTEPSHHANLGFMYVVPDHRGEGVNRLILQELFRWAKEKGLPETRLTVYPGNRPALRAYEKAGFAPYILEMRKRLDH
ncbi:MAG: GNAT family N-acetyltransferase [Planctomycetota bacterium]